MSYNVKLFSFNKKVNSTARPTLSDYDYTADCVLKVNSSILNPTFDLYNINSKNNTTTNNVGELANINYMVVNWGNMNRYYFIKDIISINNNHYLVTAITDSLATFKTAIGGKTYYIIRSSASYDTKIYDNVISPKAVCTTKTNSRLFNGIDTSKNTNIRNSILSWTTNNISTTSTTVGKSGIQIVNWNKAPQELTNELLDQTNLWADIENPSQYITELTAFPFNIGTGGVYAVMLGNNHLASVSVAGVDLNTGSTLANRRKTLFSGVDVANIDLTYGSDDYRRYDNNYTKLILSVPYVGDVVLNNEILNFDQIYVSYVVDMVTGTCIVKISGESTGKDVIFHEAVGQMGVSFPVGLKESNAGVLWNDGMNIASDIIGSSQTGIGAGVLSGNPVIGALGFASGMASAVPDIANAYKDIKVGDHYTTLAGSNSIVGSTFYYDTPVLNIIERVSEDDTYTNYVGKPLYQTKQINSISGYIQCLGASFSTNGVFEDEIKLINTALNNGFYYE